MQILNEGDIVFLVFLGVFVILSIMGALSKTGVPKMPNPPPPPHLKTKH